MVDLAGARDQRLDPVEAATIVRDDGSELAIHAMKMRARYEELLPEG